MARQLKRFIISSVLECDLKQTQRRIFLTPSETHHLRDVLRMKENDVGCLVDHRGNEVEAKVKGFLMDGRAEMELISDVVFVQPLGFCLTVAQAVPQHRKMDVIAEKAAELGVLEVIPIVTERTVVRMESEKGEKAVARWQRIAAQTVKQSRLNHIPQISAPMSFNQLCSMFNRFEKVVLLHPREEGALSELMKFLDSRNARKMKNALVVIGPEGGFSPTEVKQARDRGAMVAYLRGGILKTDTAFVLAVGLLMQVIGRSDVNNSETDTR